MVLQEGPCPWGYGKLTGPAFFYSDGDEEKNGDQILHTNNESCDNNFTIEY